MGVACVGAALLAPIGWMHPEPIYVFRAGDRLHIGLRREDAALRALADRAKAAGVARLRFAASSEARTTLPPGLAVDQNTGAIVGVPTLAGTYTLALTFGLSAASAATTGAPFRLRILPAYQPAT